MKRISVITTIALVFVLFVTVIPVRAEAAAFSDTSGHWAESYILKAKTTRIVDGYPDGSFRPDGDVTRAEFVKLLLAAMKLTPGSDTAQFLHQASNYQSSVDTGSAKPLSDLSNNWLSTKGYAQVALDYGLIVASDYSNNQFVPNKPITRYEAAVIVARMLGLVYPASSYDATQDPMTFTDTVSIPDWVKGYVKQAVDTGAIVGYPDGSFQGSNNITRAEAVAMTLQAVTYAEQGVDADIKVYVEKNAYPNDPVQQRVELSAPAQVIDGTVYVPLRNVYETTYKLNNYGDFRCYWDPIRQTLSFEYGEGYPIFRSGDSRYNFSMAGSINEYSPTLSMDVRILGGELMVPAYIPNQAYMQNLWGCVWDADTKTLTLSVPDTKWEE